MNMDDLISKDSIKLNVKTLSKKRLLQDISNLAQECLGISGSELYTSLQKREILGPTGIGNGVAIPHVKIRGINKLSGFFLILEKDFGTFFCDFGSQNDLKNLKKSPQIRFGVSFGRSWPLELILNLEIEQILKRWRQKMPSWGPPGSILEAPGRDFGWFGRSRGVFLGGFFT